MSFQADIYTALTTDATLSGLVGDRVFCDVADVDTATPYLVFQVVSTAGETTHDGLRNLDFPLVQFSAWADSKASAVAIGSAVVDVLDGQTLAGDSNLSCTFSDCQGRHEPSTNLYGETLDFRGACNRN